MKVETKLQDRLERERLVTLRNTGYFERPVFPLPTCLEQSCWRSLIPAIATYRSELNRFATAGANDVGFTNDNSYFFPPDSDVLYVMIREHRPARIVEIGSGNSTRIIRQAIRDGGLCTRLVSIDPRPRTSVLGYADEIWQHEVQRVPAEQLADELTKDDVLFIDSSHSVAVGNDCVYELLQLLPKLRSGVIVHVHDVSLPWDYPWTWLSQEPSVATWSEQYLLQALLMFTSRFQVLWPGYFIQQTNDDTFDTWFPQRAGRDASSFWMRVTSND